MSEPGSPSRPKGLSFGPAWAWLFAPDGRMGRVDYFYAVFARAFAIALPLAVLQAFEPALPLPSVPVWTIAVILTAGGPTVRRFHDLGLGGLHAAWLCLSLVLGCALFYQLPRPSGAETAILFLLSAIPCLLVLALMVWPSEKNANRYGPSPA
jgi:uncharacterized membrane protein YhaH (DUF805 family)